MTVKSSHKQKEWAVYQGDEFQFIGTTKECAERLGVTTSTIRFYSTDSYKKRIKEDGNGLILVDLGYEED